VNPVIKTFQFGQSTVTLETGRIARQASGAVLVTVDNDVTVLVTVVGAKQADPGKGFFPLSVHYQEKTYAAARRPSFRERNPHFAFDRSPDPSAVSRRFHE
jgi:polyribonucleotide nucleotidyltransferase